MRHESCQTVSVHLITAALHVPAGSSNGTSQFFTIWLPVIVAVVLFALGIWTGAYLRQPKLKVDGGGGSGWSAAMAASIYRLHVTNPSGWFGIHVGPTVILGLRIHSRFAFGVPITRDAPTKCTAWLLTDEGDGICGLYWRQTGSQQDEIILDSLQSGETAELMAFVQPDDDLPRYFPYEPAQGQPFKPWASGRRYSGKQTFIIRVMWLNGQKKSEVKIIASPSPQDGKLRLKQKLGPLRRRISR
jgi:hypothetical protein